MSILIAGLGNHPSEYSLTRHNLGFLVADALAGYFSVQFSVKNSFSGAVAKGFTSNNENIYILKPHTYMNKSGEAVIKILSYYDIPHDNLIVIHDDLDLKFGMIRTRLKGSSGGHNGLKSVEEHIKTSAFKKVRMGIGNEDFEKIKSRKNENGAANFVLSQFNEEEKKHLYEFCKLGMESTLQFMINKLPETRKLQAVFKDNNIQKNNTVKDEVSK